MHHSGSYRGFDSCIACHGNAGAEDRPRYVAANAPTTDGVSVSFRELLHAIHRGRSAATAGSFGVVGAGSAPYPDNFTFHTFEQVGFPARPGASAQCARCHGESNTSWRDVAPRSHPTAASVEALAWRGVCAACHDTSAAAAHFDLQTSGGSESCAVCHSTGDFDALDVVHRAR
jgi:OmcA/MtrC family decaheme c-type cytochrome